MNLHLSSLLVVLLLQPLLERSNAFHTFVSWYSAGAHHMVSPNQEEDPTVPLTEVAKGGDGAAPGNHRRRLLLRSAVAAWTVLSVTNQPSLAASTNENFLVPNPPQTGQYSWPLGKVAFSLLPLSGGSRRATVETEIVPDTIWTHDQIQGIVNVNVPVRQTVIRLQHDGGGLWVHNPVAPTPQLLSYMRSLEQKYNCTVQHIVLGTVALEHKTTFGPFASHFPDATCWVQPGQWSFPVQVPIEFLGVTQRGRRLRELPVPGRPQSSSSILPDSRPPPWVDEIDYLVLGPFQFASVGGFSETTFYHRATKSLIVTDIVTSVTSTPPAIIQEDPRALIFHSRDSIADTSIEDTPATREKGWRRMVQFGLVFFPSQISVRSVGQAFAEAKQVPRSLSNLGRDAIPISTLYPWEWAPNEADQFNFDTISQNGALFCPPILTKLILDREPEATLAFVDAVCRRFPDMQRVIPCHLDNDVRIRGPRDFAEAFAPLRSRPGQLVPQRALGQDLALLQEASDILTRLGVVAPSLVCDGEPARIQGRFARR